MTEKIINSIHEALNDAGFDWDSGRIYRPIFNASGRGLLQIANDDSYLDGRANYYAIDNTFVYMSAFMNFFGTEGVFPGKARADSVQTIEINTEKYFEGNTLKDMLTKVINGLEILSMTDVQSPPDTDIVFHIVGSKDVPFFVCTISEEDSIKLFINRIIRSARLSVLNQTMENQMLSMIMGKGMRD